MWGSEDEVIPPTRSITLDSWAGALCIVFRVAPSHWICMHRREVARSGWSNRGVFRLNQYLFVVWLCRTREKWRNKRVRISSFGRVVFSRSRDMLFFLAMT